MQELNLKTTEQIEQERLKEELDAIWEMAKTDGWFYIKQWMQEQLKGLNQVLYTCDPKDVERVRGEAAAFNKIITYIDNSIDTRNNLNKQ